MERFASVRHLRGGSYYWCRDSGLSLRLEEGSVVLETVQMIKKTSC